jgi:hypothetical protein
MKEPITYVTQSRFFTPAFNAAIFDGPIRIYFAQHQEAQALKLYFNFKERFGEVRKQARGIFKERGRNIFVMLYPCRESFQLSFSSQTEISEKAAIVRDQLGLDFVVGVCGPLEDSDLGEICLAVDAIVREPVSFAQDSSETPNESPQFDHSFDLIDLE